MPVTPTYGLPYPSLSDPPHGPSQLQTLAEEVETELARVDGVDAGQTSDIAALEARVDFPSFMLRRTTTLSLATSTFTAIGLNAEDDDSHGGHDNVTNNDRYTVQKAGLYVVGGGVGFAGNAVNTRVARLTKNAAAVAGSGGQVLATEATNITVVPTRVVLVQCVVGDVLRVEGWQNSGGPLNTATADYGQPTLVGHWLRP